MISDPPPVTLTITLSDGHAWHLAQFLKRVSFDTVERHAGAGERDEAAYMMEALSAIRRALASQGYAPR